MQNKKATLTILLGILIPLISLGQVTDIDGNTYKTVTIGEQTWMAEDLKTATYNDGTEIPNVTEDNELDSLNKGAYAWYDNEESRGETYGALYNWYAVKTGKLCPDGWHVPSDEEWKELEMQLDMSQSEADDTRWRGTNEGSKLAGNASLWSPDSLTSDSEFGTSGFTALPGGSRGRNGGFSGIGNGVHWWSSTEYSSASAWARGLGYDHTDVGRGNHDSEKYGSVRCVRDE